MAISAVVTGVFAGAGPAAAQYGYLGDYTASGVNIRTGPNTSYTSVGLGYPGQATCLFYRVTGQSINGDPYWWYHHNMATNVQGYSAEVYLGVYQPTQDCLIT